LAKESAVRKAFLSLALVLGCVFVTAGQPRPTAPRVVAQLKQIFPAAVGFSPKEGDPRHFKVFVGSGGGRQVGGYAYFTTELEPLERGYDGPIKVLVGMDTTGIIAGVIVVENHEPYGSFSVETPQFAEQFRGKSIRDKFRVGKDIDAVSRATISIASASRAVRNASRRMARQMLTPDAVQ